jgi:hypothetical protein
MRTTRKLLAVSTAVCALSLIAVAQAETVTTRTVVEQKEISGVQKTNFSAFDLNNDHVLSMAEVGEKLFYIFDTDGNEVIDNIEFNQKRVMTIIPMEKETFTYVDFDNDGQAERAAHTHESFIQKSGLMRFDDEMDGLSAADFIENSFLELDDDTSKAIELEEWKEAYTVMVSHSNAEQERYN